MHRILPVSIILLLFCSCEPGNFSPAKDKRTKDLIGRDWYLVSHDIVDTAGGNTVYLSRTAASCYRKLNFFNGDSLYQYDSCVNTPDTMTRAPWLWIESQNLNAFITTGPGAHYGLNCFYFSPDTLQFILYPDTLPDSVSQKTALRIDTYVPR